MRVAVVGGGWSGMACAIRAVQLGHRVTLFEAARTLGGRARALPCTLPDGSTTTLDNGQHILIGAYTDTLRLMQLVGIDPALALLRLPLRMVFPDDGGIQFPAWPAPWDAVAAIAGARGWNFCDKSSLLWRATRWRLTGFRCAPDATVAAICTGLTPRVMEELVEPLCVSALNLASDHASGQVFLRVLHDSMFGPPLGSNLLLPRRDLSALFPDAAARWITERGANVRLGTRVQALACTNAGWRVEGESFDSMVLATPALEAARLVGAVVSDLPGAARTPAQAWTRQAESLQYTAISTVYAWGAGARLAQPMIALRCRVAAPAAGPAQFVFDRGQLGGPAGLLAFVISASTSDRDSAQREVLQQARDQLGLALLPIQTVVEKRAAFACTPGLQRPPMQILPGLHACGDYVAGPYPATLEGAVRSGWAATPLS